MDIFLSFIEIGEVIRLSFIQIIRFYLSSTEASIPNILDSTFISVPLLTVALAFTSPTFIV